jgi:hypothetical protein
MQKKKKSMLNTQKMMEKYAFGEDEQYICTASF